MSATPQYSAPFQGISTWAQVQQAYDSGQLSTADALTIMQSMQTSNPQGVPGIQLGSSAQAPSAQGSPSMARLMNITPGQPLQLGTAQNPTGSGTPAGQSTSGCPSFSITNPIPWIQCEGLNLLLMFMGIAGIVIVFSSMFKTSPLASAAVEMAEI